MNILCNSPAFYQKYDTDDDNIHADETKLKDWLDFLIASIQRNQSYDSEMIQVIDETIPVVIQKKITDFVGTIKWSYGLRNNSTLLMEDVMYDELQTFYVNVKNNIYFTELFNRVILPAIDDMNKNDLVIDRVFIAGQLHGASLMYHRDERTSKHYGPSIFVFLNDVWNPYMDGSLSFILSEEATHTLHVENYPFRIVVFPPYIYHKITELSGYALLENKMSVVLQYHLVYNQQTEKH